MVNKKGFGFYELIYILVIIVLIACSLVSNIQIHNDNKLINNFCQSHNMDRYGSGCYSKNEITNEINIREVQIIGDKAYFIKK